VGPTNDPLDGLGPLGDQQAALAALELPGCPVCHALPAIEAELVGWFAQQAFSDPDSRGRVLAGGGLCARHWRQVAAEDRRRSRGLLGTAELFADVLSRSAPADQAPAPMGCPLCGDLEASARHRLYLLLDAVGRTALEHAPPRWRPCLPHLRGLRQLRLERWLERWARDRERATLEQATAAARRYVRTRQQRYQHQATGTETQDLLDALAAVLGPDAYDRTGDTDPASA
jgi:hypothetical protein